MRDSRLNRADELKAASTTPPQSHRLMASMPPRIDAGAAELHVWSPSGLHYPKFHRKGEEAGLYLSTPAKSLESEENLNQKQRNMFRAAEPI
ncbi:unnamed protein product [Pleuronectes platessa]|uniref:Uncharacterized protein n=1 Tax=Pleuronectes platessa TaxID=8262 RepID=A0A9N7Y9J1_PLEPL|nr:unnamed protein product [Pleuronectes platessa]